MELHNNMLKSKQLLTLYFHNTSWQLVQYKLKQPYIRCIMIKRKKRKARGWKETVLFMLQFNIAVEEILSCNEYILEL